MWQAGNGNAPEWRISLEDVVTHERHSFADAAGLLAFLEEQIGEDPRPQPISKLGDTSID
jgi:hypothetical protein